jgi:hypothetical protein
MLVRPEKGKAGWAYLPDLSGEHEVVNFVGGVIRLLRQDYSGAIGLLQDVHKSSSNETLKIDSLLLQALAKIKMGMDAGPQIDAALELNPYLQTTIKYKIVSLVAKIKGGSAPARRVAVSELAHQISENSYLFSPRDEWFDTARIILAVLQR